VPTIERVAAVAGLPLSDALALAKVPRVVTSLDRPLREGSEATLGELFAAEGREVDEQVVLSLRSRTVRRAVAELPDPDRRVVQLRFGIDGDAEPHTQAAVSRQLGLTRNQVRTIEERALSRLARVRELEALSDAA
jgi:RNA polymerase primary sigma factor